MCLLSALAFEAFGSRGDCRCCEVEGPGSGSADNAVRRRGMAAVVPALVRGGRASMAVAVAGSRDARCRLMEVPGRDRSQPEDRLLQ